MSFQKPSNEIEKIIEDIERDTERKVRSERAKKAEQIQKQYDADLEEAEKLLDRYHSWQNEYEGAIMYVEDTGDFEEALNTLEPYKNQY